jgi:3-deoxy-D-arabino-heptulosonate 7-phosphate (DAHP) synthase
MEASSLAVEIYMSSETAFCDANQSPKRARFLKLMEEL